MLLRAEGRRCTWQRQRTRKAAAGYVGAVGGSAAETTAGSASWLPAALPGPPPGSADAWRQLVCSPIVEHAWSTLSGSIIQEFLYDSFYSYLTPDREFPAEARRVLNGAFGQLASRARRVDLRAALLDLSELLMEQVGQARLARPAGPRASSSLPVSLARYTFARP